MKEVPGLGVPGLGLLLLSCTRRAQRMFSWPFSLRRSPGDFSSLTDAPATLLPAWGVIRNLGGAGDHGSLTGGGVEIREDEPNKS